MKHKWKCKDTGLLHEEISREEDLWTGLEFISVHPPKDGRTVFSSVQIYDYFEKVNVHGIYKPNEYE